MCCRCDKVSKWHRQIVVFGKWLQPEIMNSVWELMQFMTEVFLNCMKGMQQVMHHVLCMPKRGLVRQLDGHWGGNKEFQFKLMEFPIQEMQWN